MNQLHIAVRESTDFERALAEEIALYRELHPEVEFEAVPLDVERLHLELLGNGGLRSAKWDIGYIVTDWLAEAVEENALEELTPYVRQKSIPGWPHGWARSILEPLYFDSKLEEISLRARCLPRRRNLPAFAVVVNDLATAALTTDEPSSGILKKAQRHITEARITFR